MPFVYGKNEKNGGKDEVHYIEPDRDLAGYSMDVTDQFACELMDKLPEDHPLWKGKRGGFNYDLMHSISHQISKIVFSCSPSAQFHKWSRREKEWERFRKEHPEEFRDEEYVDDRRVKEGDAWLAEVAENNREAFRLIFNVDWLFARLDALQAEHDAYEQNLRDNHDVELEKAKARFGKAA